MQKDYSGKQIKRKKHPPYKKHGATLHHPIDQAPGKERREIIKLKI